MSDLDRARKALEEADAQLDVPPPRWAAILRRARFQIVAALVAFAAIGAGGAAALVAGGVSAREAIKDDGSTTTPMLSDKPNLTISIGGEGFTVRNDSGMDAGPFEVSVTIDTENEPLALPPFPFNEGLKAEASDEGTFECAEGGRVTATVDSGDAVDESNEDDNVAEADCLPNLTISIGGEGFAVQNASQVDAGPFEVSVTISAEGEAPPPFSFTGLAAGGETEEPFACTEGAHVTTTVDSEGAVEESNEEDNLAEFDCPIEEGSTDGEGGGGTNEDGEGGDGETGGGTDGGEEGGGEGEEEGPF